MRLLTMILCLFPMLAQGEPRTDHRHADKGIDWIRKHPKLGWCCGPQDCKRLPPGAVKPTPRGWSVVPNGEIIPYGKTLPAPDTHGPIACYNLSTMTVRCLFMPQSGG